MVPRTRALEHPNRAWRASCGLGNAAWIAARIERRARAPQRPKQQKTDESGDRALPSGSRIARTGISQERLQSPK